MTIDKTQENAATVLTLAGNLDTTTAPGLSSELLPLLEETKQVILDFSLLGYVSSAGLRVLLMGEKTAKAKGSAMALRHVSDEVMEVLEMTGFADILTIEK